MDDAPDAEAEDELLTPEEFFAETKRIDSTITPLLHGLSVLLSRLEQRLMNEETHDCPADHQVYESLEQSKLRLAEGLMWLRTAVATKVASAEGDVIDLPFVHHEGGDPPN
jgi:hypothetical protein